MANEPLNPATLFAPAKPKPALSALAGLANLSGGGSLSPGSSTSASAAAAQAPASGAFPWAARLHQRDAEGLWDLRLLPHVEAGLSGEFIWLRGPTWSDQTGAVLGLIPSAHWYEAQPGGKLREIERLLPTGRLPQLTWLPLYDALKISAPSTALPARFSTATSAHRVPLQLERSGVEHPANLLVVEPLPWKDYIDMEPAVRFQGLYFAVASDGNVCVGHKPGATSSVLPSLPGRRFWTQDGIAVPCGWTWSPALPAAIVRTALWTQRAAPTAKARGHGSAPPPLPPKFGGADSFAASSSGAGSASGAKNADHPLASQGWLYLWHPDNRAPQWIAAGELILLSRSAARLSLGRN